MSYFYASDFPFKNFCKLTQHAEKIRKKNVWEKSNDVCSLSIKVQTTLNHILICFSPQYQHQRKCFFQTASQKRHCVTHWRKQHGMDSYWQRQISQSDCEISSNCGKKVNWMVKPLCIKHDWGLLSLLYSSWMRIERFSIECRNTKTKVITLANHKGHRQSNKPIKIRSNYM